MQIKFFKDKLEAILEKLNLSPADLSAYTGLGMRTIKIWLNSTGIETRVREDKHNLLIHYLKEEEGIVLSKRERACSVNDFRAKLGLAPIVAPTNFVHAHILGTYQLLRPHSFEPDTYIFEPFEILEHEQIVYCRALSHRNASRDHLYDGHGYSNGNYFMSLVKRRHETDDNLHSFRSYTIFLGDSKSFKLLSGIMTRGTKGLDSSKQAAALPFVAIPMAETYGVNDLAIYELENKSLLYNHIVKLHRESAILIGNINGNDKSGLFDLCQGIFKHPKFQNNVCQNNQPSVLRTISQTALSQISVDREIWKQLVAQL